MTPSSFFQVTAKFGTRQPLTQGTIGSPKWRSTWKIWFLVNVGLRVLTINLYTTAQYVIFEFTSLSSLGPVTYWHILLFNVVSSPHSSLCSLSLSVVRKHGTINNAEL